MIIAVDFDGVCVKDQWPAAAEDFPGAPEALRALQAEGHKLIIWTCRVWADYWGPASGKQYVVNWLYKHEINARLNENDQGRLRVFYGNEARKISADVYIDDKNLGGFPGWEKALEIIRGMDPRPRLADTPLPISKSVLTDRIQEA